MKLLRFFIIAVFSCFLFGQGSGTAVKCGTDDVFVGFCSADFGFNTQLTITAWVKWNQDPSTGNAYANIVSNSTPASNNEAQFWLQHSSTDNSKFQFAVKSDNSRRFVNSTTSPQANTWYHVAGVCDLTEGNKKITIYVNGVQENSNGISGTKITDFLESYYFKAAKSSAATSPRYFHGDIDELTIWNTALTENEIRDMMCEKLAGDETGLVGYWRFDENDKDVTEDLSPNSNNGHVFRESGKAESGTSTTLTDNNKTWNVDEWKDRFIGISAGTGNGQKRIVLSNTADEITVSSAWTTTPDNTSQYVISDYNSWVVSGAPIGDRSLHNYTSPNSVGITSTAGDGIALNSVSGSPAGVQVYCVDTAPNVSTPPGNLVNLSSSHYFGAFIVGGTTPTYTLTYNYAAHPGITNESVLDLAKRSNNASTSWVESNATLNNTLKTLTLTGQSGTEYILGSESGENPLPVTLSSFTANIENAYPTLKWSTESELENLGFIIERRDKGALAWTEIASYRNESALEGHGTTSETNNYQFVDNTTIAGLTYEYRLSNVDYNGQLTHHEILEIQTPEVNTDLPTQFSLNEAYPNPFNPTTTISYNLATSSDVKIIVRNINGKSIQEWSFTSQEAGNHAVIWNANDQVSGVYIFQMITENFTDSKKMVLIK